VSVLASLDARSIIAEEQARPNQSGVFGLLSIGFIASALLTVLGYLLHSILSFRERFIELGVLRAIGLSAAQLAAFLSGEQLVLIGSGVGVGTVLGVLTTKLFVPFFQVSDDLHPFTPPFDVRIAWGDIAKIYAVFGVMLVIAIMVLILLLRRIKISQAIKLGETA
jgi:putative ABC transport system permease protein